MRWAVVGFLILIIGCAKALPSAKSPAPDWKNEEERLMACLDLQDHIVDLYAADYIYQHREEIGLMSTLERKSFRDGWAEDLAKGGTFDRFEQSCFYSLTVPKYHCGMQSNSPDGLVACMKLSS